MLWAHFGRDCLKKNGKANAVSVRNYSTCFGFQDYAAAAGKVCFNESQTGVLFTLLSTLKHLF